MTLKLPAALLAVLLSAPAFAAHDVQVVNNADHPVPVKVQGTPTVTLAAGAAVQVTNTAASPVAVRAADNDARNAFQALVTLNLNNFSYTPVAIPAGKRLVVEYVAITGSAASSQGGVQPVVLLNTSLNGGGAINFYLQAQQSAVAPMQFYKSEQTRIYADALSVGFGFSGYTPYELVMQVAISGHLVDLTVQ